MTLHEGCAAEDGIHVGEPVRGPLSHSAKDRLGKRYGAADCPFCEGPLFYAPQCIGRAVTAAAPHRAYWYDPLPSTHVAVACRSCEFAFFPLVTV